MQGILEELYLPSGVAQKWQIWGRGEKGTSHLLLPSFFSGSILQKLLWRRPPWHSLLWSPSWSIYETTVQLKCFPAREFQNLALKCSFPRHMWELYRWVPDRGGLTSAFNSPTLGLKDHRKKTSCPMPDSLSLALEHPVFLLDHAPSCPGFSSSS